jgi:hypothetical protein
MIRGGIPTAQIERYLHQRAWLTDAARLLDRVHKPSRAAELLDRPTRGSWRRTVAVSSLSWTSR